MQAVDPAARLLGVAEEGELRDAEDEEADGEATAPQFPHQAQIPPITIISCPTCTSVENPPCASSAPSPAPRTYAAIVNAWMSTPTTVIAPPTKTSHNAVRLMRATIRHPPVGETPAIG